MRKVKSIAAFVLLAAAMLMVLPAINATAQEGQEESEVTVTGVIEAFEYDDNDKVISVSVVNEEEEVDYLIADEGVGHELLDAVGKKVVITGVLSEDEYGDPIISVSTYEFEEKEQ